MNLVKKTKLKFFVILNALTFIVFLILNVAIFVTLSVQESTSTDSILKETLTAYSNGKPGGGISPDDKIKNLKTFYIEIDLSNNTITKSVYDADFYSVSTLESYKYIIINKKENSGRFANIVYIKEKFTSPFETNPKLRVAATDRTYEIENFNYVTTITITSSVLAFLIIAILFYFLVGMFVKPLENTIIKEKIFISDASHELKTPLAIINANASVLQKQMNNKYIDNIINETNKMDELVIEMLNSSKLNEQMVEETSIIENINLSKELENIALSFDALAYENNINFTSNIEPNIVIKGNKKSLNKLVTILIDNSLKYAKNAAKLNLFKIKKSVVITFFNDGKGIPKEDIEKIYDRFYQVDKSRNALTKKGFGLGLNMAKSICDKYKYKIKCESKVDEYTEFTVYLS